MSALKRLVCVQCPLGCKISVELSDTNRILSIVGNRCPRGEEYARDELENPKRVLTTSVRVLNGEYPLVSVKTNKPVPKNLVPELMKTIRNLKVEAPIECGSVLVEDVLGTGADLVATRTVRRAKG